MGNDKSKSTRPKSSTSTNKILEGRDQWLERIAPGLPQFEVNRHRWKELVDKLILDNYKPDRIGRISGDAGIEWYREIVARGILLRTSSLVRPDGVYEFEWGQLTIRCLLANELVMAWVGTGKFGRIVLFDDNSFKPAEKLSTRADYLAYGLAISWYVDVHSLSNKEIETIAIKGNVYQANSAFDHYVKVAKSSPQKIPRVSHVIGHLRKLPLGQKPSRDQRDAVPDFLIAEMKAQHTYVQPHTRKNVVGDNKKEAIEYFRKHSATASAIALLG